MKFWTRSRHWTGVVRATHRAESRCVCARPSVVQRPERAILESCTCPIMTHRVRAMIPGDLISMTDVAQLNGGRFYWVLVRSSTKDPEWQPARFTGVAGSRWNFIGFNGDIGHHFIEVVDIGPEITDGHASPAT